MFSQFTNNFRQKLQSQETSQPQGAPKPIGAVGLAFSALKATLTGKVIPPQPPSGESKPQDANPADQTGGKQ